MRQFITGLVLGLMILVIYAGVSNFGRIALSETPEITGSNSETISNSTNGTWDFGAANLTTTGAVTSGALSADAVTCGALSADAVSLSDNVSFGVDSSIGIVLAASDSTLWRIKVSPSGALSADSAGLN